MIAKTAPWESEADWFDLPQGFCDAITVDAPSHARVSELLGPDGEPLRVGYERPKLGFDLRPKG